MRHETLVARLIGDRGRMREIRFTEAGIDFAVDVNEDALWTAVKDNLVLAEYERCGIALGDQRGVVVDAGAHVGLFSLLASAHARRVIALEPHPGNFELLRRNIERNARDNVDARQRALWPEPRTVALVDGRESTSVSVRPTDGGEVAVAAETLDSIVSAPVDLLKLDVEGAEYDILTRAEDSTLRRISAIVAEVHGTTQSDPEGRLTTVSDRLRDAGFHVIVRRAPAAYWLESMRAVLRSRQRLRGVVRLQLAVVLAYTIAAATDPLLHLRDRFEFDFAFLFATRNRASTAADRR
ncbi:MAG: FkbM family methyltransferase [Thermoleophilia bacterium]|nr:FkbM family methyltransferase [Thermoleophilia bacterium]